jgi:hypothetical protein
MIDTAGVNIEEKYFISIPPDPIPGPIPGPESCPPPPYIYSNDLEKGNEIGKGNPTYYVKNCLVIAVGILSLLGLIWGIVNCYFYIIN